VYVCDNTLQCRSCLDVRQSEPLSSVHLRGHENQCTVSTNGPRVRFFAKRQSGVGLPRDSHWDCHQYSLTPSAVCREPGGLAGFGSYYLNSGSELVTRMSPAVCPRKRGGGLNRLFRLDGGNELVTRRSLAFCLVKHDGGFSGCFRFHGGNELVAKINHVV